MSEKAIIDFVTRAAPVIRQLERNTGRAARSVAIAIETYYSHRSTQRFLSAAEQYGYVWREGVRGGWRLASTPVQHPPANEFAVCMRQLELPFGRAA